MLRCDVDCQRGAQCRETRPDVAAPGHRREIMALPQRALGPERLQQAEVERGRIGCRRPTAPGPRDQACPRSSSSGPRLFAALPRPPRLARLGIATCGLAALAACGDHNLTGLPTVDLSLSRIAGFDPLKAALVQARNEDNGDFNLDMWAAVVVRNG